MISKCFSERQDFKGIGMGQNIDTNIEREKLRKTDSTYGALSG